MNCNKSVGVGVTENIDYNEIKDNNEEGEGNGR